MYGKPNITNEDVKKMINMADQGYSNKEIGDVIGFSDATVANILKRNNVITRGNGKRVKCITTGEVFNSITKASKHYNTHNAYIVKCCEGKKETAGEYDGVPLKWKYV